MNQYPFTLNKFLESLSSEGIHISVSDYEQLSVLFHSESDWSLVKFRNVITACLAKNEEQQELIQRRFDSYINNEIETANKLYQDVIHDKKNDLIESDSSLQPKKQDSSQLNGSINIEQAKRKPKKLIWCLFTFICILISLFTFNWYDPFVKNKIIKNQVQRPNELNVPYAKEIKLRPNLLNFGIQDINKEIQKEVSITNNDSNPITIDNAYIKGNKSNVFKIPDLGLPMILAGNQTVEMPVTFKPINDLFYSDTLVFVHSADNINYTVNLSGSGRKITAHIQKRLYQDMPYVEQITHELIQSNTEWKKYAVMTGTLLVGIILYSVYIILLLKNPSNISPKINENVEQHYNRACIGGNPSQLLDDKSISYIAESMGYFRSNIPGKKLNVKATINATINSGGIPTFVFFQQPKIKTLLILEDIYAEALKWNSISKELAEGMINYEIPVIYGKFKDTPEQFKTQDNTVYLLDDFDRYRKGILCLIFTDGKCFHRLENPFILERISRWPMVAWMELRHQQFWDASFSLPLKHNIPLYPATPKGIMQTIKHFVSEQGARREQKNNITNKNPLPQYFREKPEIWIEHLLGDALLWAQDCSMIQPITPGLIQNLRQRFHPNIPAEKIEYLYQIPNTIITDSGLYFSDDILKALKKGFFSRRSKHEESQVIQFILDQLEEAKPDKPRDSLSYLSWEAIKERVKLEMPGTDNLERFGQLNHTPLKYFFADSFHKCGFSDDDIPIRKPDNKIALKRLAQVCGNPLNINLNPWKHIVCLGVVILCFSIFLVLIFQNFREEILGLPNIEISEQFNIPSRIEQRVNNKWIVDKSVTILNQLNQKHLKENTEYRLFLYDKGYYSINEFQTIEGKKTILFIGKQDIDRKCIEH